MRGDGDHPVGDFFQNANVPRFPKGLVAIGLVVLLVLSLFPTVFYQVEADEVAVVQRFGKYVRSASPGLKVKLPFGLETAKKVKAQRVFRQAFGFRPAPSEGRARFSPRRFPHESLMLTGDLNLADVQWMVQYQIADPATYLFGNRDPEKALSDAAQIAMRTIVGDYTVTEVLTERRLEIANETQKRLQGLLDLYETGLRVVTVAMQNVMPPSDAVKDAFNEVSEARQERERKINEAHQAYNRAVPRARGEAKGTVTQAEGKNIRRINRAKGDVARFEALLAAYQKAPDVTRRRLYLETMHEMLPTVGQIYVFDADKQAALLPFLDLKRRAGANSRPVPGASQAKEP